MQIICVSRGSFGYGNELAVKLAQKLGYDCIARETLTDGATDRGIPVGKIESAVLKRHPITEALALQMELMKAFICEQICGRALEKSVVYHGRTGHLVLPGISHVLRIRAIANDEERIKMTLRRMPNLTREKAKRYNDQVDEDRRRWVRTLYNADWEDPSLYDVTINFLNMTAENSASALVSIAQLPEFKATPASMQAVQDRLLASRCRLAIGRDDRTREIGVTVKADHGNVAVTYLPRQSKEAAFIPEVLGKIDGIQSIVCTVATTNILYIQESFDPDAPSLEQVIQVAEKWNASIELIRLLEGKGAAAPEAVTAPAAASSGRAADGGILDDASPALSHEGHPDGVAKTFDKLIQVGRANTVRTIPGGAQKLLSSLNRSEQNSLVVVGDVFLAREMSVRKRMRRDLISFLADHLKIPVISTEDLKGQYLFGTKQWLHMALCAVATVAVYLAVFYNQEAVLQFTSAPGTGRRVLSAALVALFVPIVAWIYGSFSHYVLKLIKLE
ncbi:MAG: cytidylate kinase-like family protein [Acidobacteria bacterium]|nr:cytidylate kinase-like family protein [Acidobacteriota bacterium]